VTAGKPSELAFKLSKISMIPAGTVIFNVKNSGRIAHSFEICLAPSATAPNKCKGKGKATRMLQPGQSATVTVTLTKNGIYEYICTFPGHAAAGMKGLIGIGVPLTAARVAKIVSTPTTTTPTTTAPTTTAPTTTAPTTTAPTTTTPTTTVVNDGCPPGVTISTSGNGDNDFDEKGQPSDGDGCV